MKKMPFKKRCEKRKLPKFIGLCETYDSISRVYADKLIEMPDIANIRCNVPLEGLDEKYASDFVCTKVNGELMVRECLLRAHVTRPAVAKLLEESREYWRRHGVGDWGIVIDGEK